jgi:hypothetical protein
MDWTDLPSDRNWLQMRVNTITKLRVLKNSGIFLTARKTISFSRRTLLHRESK